MSDKGSYGQFCPLALATEFLCTRWSILIFRELFLGATAFNDISRGVARMSRTLLSARLKEFVERGLLTKDSESAHYAQYKLTPAGEALRPVVFGMADWSQEWLHLEPALVDIDVDHLMWGIKRKAVLLPELPNPFIVHFFFPEQPENFQNYWLVFKNDLVDLCIVEHDFEVNVEIECSAETLTKIWMGWSPYKTELKNGCISVRGQEKLTLNMEKWLGHSRLAGIKKQPVHLRVG